MRLINLYILICLCLVSCEPKPGDGDNARLRNENFNLKQENDSLREIINKDQRKKISLDTIEQMADTTKSANSNFAFAGQHSITLQWIGWNEPGVATIEKNPDGWYKISGSQYSKNKQDYLTISGRIKPVNLLELEFDGRIETKVEEINAGKPCLKTGKQTFKASSNKKYWRLQNMTNCEGNMVTDYIDIYF